MGKVLLHIGLPKTATSTLQTHLFYKLHLDKKINFLGRYLAPEYKNFYFKIFDLINAVRFEDEYKFEKNLSKYRKMINLHLKNNVLNIISEEMLTISYGNSNIKRNLIRLKKILEGHEVQILLSIRRQDTIIYSFFVEIYPTTLFKDKYNNTIDKYLINGLKNKKNGNFLMFYYDEILNFCEKTFGNNSCKILIFEDLKHNKQRYIKTLKKVLNISFEEIDKCISNTNINEKRKLKDGYMTDGMKLSVYVYNYLAPTIPKYLKKYKVINNIFSTLINNLNFIKLNKKKIKYLTKEQEKLILKEFNHSNTVLDEKLKLNLFEYGYYKKGKI
jgi:hypothetical protein